MNLSPISHPLDRPIGSRVLSIADNHAVSHAHVVFQAEYLLGLRSPTTGSIFDDTGGTLVWIAAGRYGGHLSAPTMPHPDDADLTGESAFTELVAMVGGKPVPCVRLPLN